MTVLCTSVGKCEQSGLCHSVSDAYKLQAVDSPLTLAGQHTTL